MELTKQERALVNFIKGLCFDDLLDAYEGLMCKAGDASMMSTKKRREGDIHNADGFKERSEILEKLADLLGNANSDYRAHIMPESAGEQKGTIQMIESNAGEVVHLFEIMKKYGATCGLEFNTNKSSDPLFGIAFAKVDVEYFEREGGPDAVIVKLDEVDFGFDLGTHSFSKYISDCQIDVLIMSDDYAAWFNSSELPIEGIDEAKDYEDINEEQYFAIDTRGKDVAELLENIAKQLRSGWSVAGVSDSIKHDGHLYIDLVKSGEGDTE